MKYKLPDIRIIIIWLAILSAGCLAGMSLFVTDSNITCYLGIALCVSTTFFPLRETFERIKRLIKKGASIQPY